MYIVKSLTIYVMTISRRLYLSAALSTYYLFNRNIYYREYYSKMYIYSLYPYQSEFLSFSLSYTIKTSSDKAEPFLINFYDLFFRDFSSITIGTHAHTIISIMVDLLNHSFKKQYSKLWENFNFDDRWTLSKTNLSFIGAHRLKFEEF